MTPYAAGDPASHQLAIVTRELSRLVERLEDAAALARRLSGETAWQAKAATAFHERADIWAAAVATLPGLAESACQAAAHARDRAAFLESARAVSLQIAGSRP
ncbi:hypothetical protein JNB62_03605 [Microbacterium jejuense]|uniref:Uncharacterized protein n=1 Tax=Microbacterium jejuense TaxID=1263637 RepID=A0ABS7HIL7_9MICO|nr:hypothetical protein [Microbacterium jejuense]MBW9092764.1 hypothetical protein [Microbacterium jejuense]